MPPIRLKDFIKIAESYGCRLEVDRALREEYIYPEGNKKDGKFRRVRVSAFEAEEILDEGVLRIWCKRLNIPKDFRSV